MHYRPSLHDFLIWLDFIHSTNIIKVPACCIAKVGMGKVCSGTGSLKKEDQQLRLAPSASRIILTRKSWTLQETLPSQGPWGRWFTLLWCIVDEVTDLVQNQLECLLNAGSPWNSLFCTVIFGNHKFKSWPCH